MLSCFVCSAAVLSGCGYTWKDYHKKVDTMMAAWEGDHISNLMAQWGPPNRITEDGRGGKIYCYDKEGYNTSQYVNTNSYHTRVSSSYRHFWADKNGMIYRSKWSGVWSGPLSP